MKRRFYTANFMGSWLLFYPVQLPLVEGGRHFLVKIIHVDYGSCILWSMQAYFQTWIQFCRSHRPHITSWPLPFGPRALSLTHADFYFHLPVLFTALQDKNCVTFVQYLTLTPCHVHWPLSEICLEKPSSLQRVIGLNLLGVFVFMKQRLLLHVI